MGKLVGVRYNIIAPLGGFGNHVRWLILLDPSFDLTINYGKDIINLTSLDQKIAFFNGRVYPNDRSWDNWLQIEWAYRDSLNRYIPFGHDINELLNPDVKTILLKTNPELAYRSYIKFNSNLNTRPKHRFISDVNETNSIVADKPHQLSLDSDVLYNEVLDQKFYNDLVGFLELENLYTTAQQIHSKWYHLHKNAEQGITDHFINLYRK